MLKSKKDEGSHMTEDKKNIENEKLEIAKTKQLEERKNGKDVLQTFEDNLVKARRQMKIIKCAKHVFKIASITLCLISAALFLSAVIEKNDARSKFKKTQEYHEIVKQQSSEIYNKFQDEQISSYEYLKETKALSSNKFVDSKIKNSTTNLDIKKEYQNHSARNIAGVCNIAGAIGLSTSQIYLNKKLAKVGKEEQFYQKFFR